MLWVRKLGLGEIIQDYRVRQAVEPLTVFCYPPREALLSLKRNPLLAWLPSLPPSVQVYPHAMLANLKTHAR